MRPVPGGRPIESSRDHPPTDEPTPEVRTSYADAAHGMHPLLAKQPRFCLVCGEPLELPASKGQPAACGHCLKPFDPADPRTFVAEPPPVPRRWWESDAVPGVAWLLVYAGGYAVVGWVAPGWAGWIGGGAGSDRAGAAAGALVAALWMVFGFLPWVYACIYLLLLAFEHHLRDEIVWYLTAGALFGVVCTLGLPPAMLLVGLILGLVAGLVRQWRMSLWAGT
ncbi:MAG: hypothetical protein AAGF84_09850 [Planctomycetota bacterium]